MAEPQSEKVLLTGYPSFIARQMLERLLDGGQDVYLLALKRFVDRAREEVGALLDRSRSRGTCTVLEGDVTHLDLGLSGGEVQELISEVQVVHHMAGIYHMGVPRRVLSDVNVEGTRRVLGLAREMKSLRRFCHYSTAHVAGTRQGVIMEDDLDAGQRFRNAYEETKFRGERLVRRLADTLPTSIFRPSIVVGSSATGAVDRLRGPHLLLAVFVQLPPRLPLPLPGRGHFPLNLVPVDYVIEAAYRLSLDPRAEGGTFHLTDPNPLSVRGVFNLVSDLAERPRPLDAAVNLLPYRFTRAALRLPGIERRARGALHLIEALHSLAIYNRLGTDRLLARTGPFCPPFPDYAERLVQQLKSAGAYDFNVTFDEDDA